MKSTLALPNFSARTRWEPMPIITAASSVPVIAAAIWTALMAIVIRAPEIGDAYAILGAGAGSICAIIEARAKGRASWETLGAFIVSAAAGSFGPSVAFGLMKWLQWIPQDLEAVITWQWWAAAGFVMSLNGWLVIHLVNQKILRWISERNRYAVNRPDLYPRRRRRRPPFQ